MAVPSLAWVWVLELIDREISVLISKRAGAMSMREMASRSNEVERGGREWVEKNPECT
jgi:hypothetical protein